MPSLETEGDRLEAIVRGYNPHIEEGVCHNARFGSKCAPIRGSRPTHDIQKTGFRRSSRLAGFTPTSRRRTTAPGISKRVCRLNIFEERRQDEGEGGKAGDRETDGLPPGGATGP